MSLNKKNKRLIDIPDEILDLIKGAEAGIFDRILEIISKLEVRAGKVLPSKDNLDLLSELFTELDKLLVRSPEYREALRKYSQEIATQAGVNDDYFRSLDPDYVRPSSAEELLKLSRKRAMELLIGKEAEASLISPLKDILETSVTSGNSFAQTVKEVREFAFSSGKNESKILRYSKQIVYDNFATNDRAYSTLVSNEVGFEWFVYSGNVIKGTRQFCEDMLRVEYFHRKEIEDLGKGIGVDGKKLTQEQLQGRHDGTNEQTIFELAGGYNCRHNWMPVSEFDVPAVVKERAKAKGYVN